MMESIMKLHRCEDCPIRCQAAKKPRSIFARIHRWHTHLVAGLENLSERAGLRHSFACPAYGSLKSIR